MPVTTSGRAVVAPNILLDSRLALFHKRERWLAVADLHFGYELSQRAGGRLMPLWGMTSIQSRLMDLLQDYQPRQLFIVGDLVHDKASSAEASALLARLREHCEVIALAGNHDRHVARAIDLATRWETPGFVFQHGHCEPEVTERIQIIGHHHPAVSISDGAGLRLKFPAFVQCESVAQASSLHDQTRKLEARATRRCWILPAFSPWAGGVSWPEDGAARVWLCSPRRVLRIDGKQTVA